MSVSNTSQPHYVWVSTAPPHNDFHSRDFTILSQLRFEVDLVQSVSNQRLYVRKLLHRAPGAASEYGQNDSDEDEHNVFYYQTPPEVRVSTCPHALSPLADEAYFPKLVGWQLWDGTNWALFTE